MPYGTIKIDTITFTDGGVDKSVPVSGLVQNPTFTGNITATGTISGNIIQGGTTVSGVTVTGTTASFASGVFTTQISGVTITGTTVAATTGTFTSLTGTTTNGTTASFTTGNFTSLTGTTTTGTTANFESGVFITQVSGLLITGPTVSATTGTFTSLTGTTTTGTTATFTSGVFSTQVSGVTITGTTVATTTGTFTSLTGTTATFTSGIIASGTFALPSLAILSDPNTGIYSPGADQLAISTNGVERVKFGTAEVVFNDTGVDYDFRIEGDTNANLFFVDASTDRVGIGSTTPQEVLDVNGRGRFQGSTSSAVSGSGLELAFVSAANTGQILSYNRSTSAYLTTNIIGNPLTFSIAGTEAAKIDTSGRLLVGTSTARSNFFNTTITPGVQFESASDPRLSIVSNSSTNEFPSQLILAHQQSGAAGGNTAVNSASAIGLISFQGSDGTDFVEAARIIVEADGTPGANDMPGRLVFSTTADGGSSPTSSPPAMTIKSSQEVLIGTSTITANGGILQLKSGITFPATAVAASDANTLDDYEEGTWTPVYVAQTGTLGAITYDNVQGVYTKLGKLVTVTGGFYCTAFAAGTGSGDLRISGLPFANIANQNAISVGDSRLFTLNNPTGGQIGFSVSYVTLYYRTTANGAINNLQVSDAATGSGALNLVYFTASYQTS